MTGTCAPAPPPQSIMAPESLLRADERIQRCVDAI